MGFPLNVRLKNVARVVQLGAVHGALQQLLGVGGEMIPAGLGQQVGAVHHEGGAHAVVVKKNSNGQGNF